MERERKKNVWDSHSFVARLIHSPVSGIPSVLLFHFLFPLMIMIALLIFCSVHPLSPLFSNPVFKNFFWSCSVGESYLYFTDSSLPIFHTFILDVASSSSVTLSPFLSLFLSLSFPEQVPNPLTHWHSITYQIYCSLSLLSCRCIIFLQLQSLSFKNPDYQFSPPSGLSPFTLHHLFSFLLSLSLFSLYLFLLHHYIVRELIEVRS